MPFSKKALASFRRPLSSLLTCQNQLANLLKWNENNLTSLLAVNVSSDGVELALTELYHPQKTTSQTLPIESAKVQLETLLQHRPDIQGIIVGWPRQENGRLGYQCGKVLHFLDSVEASSCKPALCLVDPYDHRCMEEEGEDEWGRNPIYGRITYEKECHQASKEQYGPRTNVMTAADLADQFCRNHWPHETTQHSSETMWSGATLEDTDWIPAEHGQHRHLASA